MVKIIAITDRDKEICAFLERKLSTFPLFRQTDTIQAVSRGSNIAVAYLTEGNKRLFTTHFDLTLKDDVCDILDFEIRQEHRRKGYGYALYLVVEELAREYGCKRVQTSPSGQGTTFWPQMGFTKTCEVGVEKVL